MKRIKDEMGGDNREHERVARQTSPSTIHGPLFGREQFDRSIDRSPGSDDAFPESKLPEYDFFDR